MLGNALPLICYRLLRRRVVTPKLWFCVSLLEELGASLIPQKYRTSLEPDFVHCSRVVGHTSEMVQLQASLGEVSGVRVLHGRAPQ